MFLRVVIATFLLSVAAMAASHKAVCPGPAAAGAARCHSQVVTDQKGSPNAASAPSGYGPVQFRTGYGLTATGSSTTTIGIVDAYDDPNIESDLGVYSTQFQLPSCTTANGCFKKVNQTGGTSYSAKKTGGAPEKSPHVEITPPPSPGPKNILVETTTNPLFHPLTAGE